MSTFDLYQTVTDQVLAMLDAGVAPWRSPILGRTDAGGPRNLASDKTYRGINTFLLAFAAYARGYDSAYWATFNQARTADGSVKKGEKSTLVVFWKKYDTIDKKTGKEISVPVLRYYNLFNLAQCEGITPPDAPVYIPTEFNPIAAAEAVVKDFAGCPAIFHGGSSAFYRPSDDTVRMPEPTRFATGEEHYSTLFHELSHATGHRSRLDRGFETCPRPFGSADYGKEELLAEMSASFLCAHVGILPQVAENQAAYLAGWMKLLKGDKRLVVTAAGAAQKAADWILNQRGETADVPAAE